MPEKNATGVAKFIDFGLEIYKEAADKKTTITALLEAQDPSENYADMPGWNKTNAFQRQLAARDINIKTASMGVFYDSSNRALFPEFVNTKILEGKISGINEVRAEDLVGVVTPINTMNYIAPVVSLPDDTTAMKDITEGSDFPEIKITLDKRSLALRKFGYTVKMTYEVAQNITINYFQTTLRLIGQRWAQKQAGLALSTIMAAGARTDTTASGLTYKELKDFVVHHAPYDVTLMIANLDGVCAILDLSEFKDQQTGSKFQETGAYNSPFGASLKGYGRTDADLTNKIVVIDKAYALEKVVSNRPSLVEYDKITTSQWETMTVSEYVAFSRMQANACGVLTITPAESE